MYNMKITPFFNIKEIAGNRKINNRDSVTFVHFTIFVR